MPLQAPVPYLPFDLNSITTFQPLELHHEADNNTRKRKGLLVGDRTSLKKMPLVFRPLQQQERRALLLHSFLDASFGAPLIPVEDDPVPRSGRLQMHLSASPSLEEEQ